MQRGPSDREETCAGAAARKHAQPQRNSILQSETPGAFQKGPHVSPAGVSCGASGTRTVQDMLSHTQQLPGSLKTCSWQGPCTRLTAPAGEGAPMNTGTLPSGVVSDVKAMVQGPFIYLSHAQPAAVSPESRSVAPTPCCWSTRPSSNSAGHVQHSIPNCCHALQTDKAPRTAACISFCRTGLCHSTSMTSGSCCGPEP